MGVGIFYERGSILDHLWYTQWLKNTLFKYLSKTIIAVTAIDGFLQSQTQIRLWDIIIIYYFSSWHLSVSPDQPLTTVWWPVSYSFTCTNSVLSPNKPRWKKMVNISFQWAKPGKQENELQTVITGLSPLPSVSLFSGRWHGEELLMLWEVWCGSHEINIFRTGCIEDTYICITHAFSRIDLLWGFTTMINQSFSNKLYIFLC